MKKFHPEDCIHTSERPYEAGPFWARCSRHGSYYFLCDECNVETIKDNMVEVGFLPYNEVQYMTEGDICAVGKEYRKFLNDRNNKRRL